MGGKLASSTMQVLDNTPGVSDGKYRSWLRLSCFPACQRCCPWKPVGASTVAPEPPRKVETLRLYAVAICPEFLNVLQRGLLDIQS